MFFTLDNPFLSPLPSYHPNPTLHALHHPPTPQHEHILSLQSNLSLLKLRYPTLPSQTLSLLLLQFDNDITQITRILYKQYPHLKPNRNTPSSISTKHVLISKPIGQTVKYKKITRGEFEELTNKRRYLKKGIEIVKERLDDMDRREDEVEDEFWKRKEELARVRRVLRDIVEDEREMESVEREEVIKRVIR